MAGSLSLLLLAALLPLARAGVPWPDEAAWLPLVRGGVAVEDPRSDTPSPALDLVAEGAAVTAAWTASEDRLWLRVRLAARPDTVSVEPAPGGPWRWYADTDGDPATAEWLVGADPLLCTGEANASAVTGLFESAHNPSLLAGTPCARVVPLEGGDAWLDLSLPIDALGLDRAAGFRLQPATFGGDGGALDQWGQDDTRGEGEPAQDHLAEDWSDAVSIDADGDGLPTALELATGTDPESADSDGGGRADNLEDRDLDGAVGAWETDPRDASDDGDEDRDGIADALELKCSGDASSSDGDDDGLLDSTEGQGDWDQDGLPDFCDPDDDDDGIPTSIEGDDDTDRDGLPDCLDTDSDGDGILDAFEGGGDLDCDGAADYADAVSDDGPCADPDADGLDNAAEAACGSDPTARDSDGDGRDDPAESCTDDADCDQLPDRIDGVADTGFCLPPEATDEDTACVDADPSDAWHDCPGVLTGGAGCASVPGRGGAAALAIVALALAGRRRSAIHGPDVRPLPAVRPAP